jgi:predicted GIY-YIG superfamily endonuclease
MSYFVYILQSTHNATYVGATVDLDHRLRQHNGVIKGGARATTIRVKNGEVWERVCHIKGFPDWKSALQFEWRLKQLSRKLPITLFPLERRMKSLVQLLSLERATTNSIPFIEWETPPEIVFENDIAKNYYSSYYSFIN